MRNQTYIASVENLESVLEILKVLIREGIQQAQGYPGGPIQRRAQETEETIEEQGWLARIVHLIRGKDNDTQFKVSSINVQTIVRTNNSHSFSKPHASPSPKATSASSTHPPPSSQHHSSSHGNTRSANTSKTTGNHNHPLSTSSCTVHCRHSTPALPAPQTYPSASSSPVVKSQIRTASKRSHTSSSRRRSRYTRRQSATQERNSKLYASSRVVYTQRGISARRITIP